MEPRCRRRSAAGREVSVLQLYYNYHTMPDVAKRTSPSAYFSSSRRSGGKASSHLVSVRLPDELLKRLAEVGNQEGLAMSDTIRLVLERGLASRRRHRSQE